MHLTNEIAVLLVHPFVEGDAKFHCCLQYHHGIIEKCTDEIFELGLQLERHPVMDIDTSTIGQLKVTHNLGV